MANPINALDKLEAEDSRDWSIVSYVIGCCQLEGNVFLIISTT
jgi:hypothetical protein